MPVTTRPTSPARRQATYLDRSDLTDKSPEKALLRPHPGSGGRNNRGRVTNWHRGGGHPRMYRMVDFKREKLGIPARVAAIEYDPNRSARLALLHYADGEKRYILCPLGVNVGDALMSGAEAEIRPGNTLPLRALPDGTQIHNLEVRPGCGGQLVRSAGAVAQLMAKEGNLGHVKLPSGEIRYLPLDCMATIGQVGNINHENISLGGAGRARHMGRRPVVRGTAMNTVDHPHGGGRGKSKGGNHPSTPWGQPTKGFKTRGRKYSDRSIVRRRPRGVR